MLSCLVNTAACVCLISHNLSVCVCIYLEISPYMSTSHGTFQTVTAEGRGEGPGSVVVRGNNVREKGRGVGCDADCLRHHGNHRSHVWHQGGRGRVVSGGRGDGRHGGCGQGVLWKQ